MIVSLVLALGSWVFGSPALTLGEGAGGTFSVASPLHRTVTEADLFRLLSQYMELICPNHIL